MSSDQTSFPKLARPGRPLWLTIALLNLKGWWAHNAVWLLDTIPPLIVAALAANALFFQLSLEKLAMAAGAAALLLGLRAALRPGALVAPLALPKSLSDAGWTAELATRRLLDAAARELAGVQARDVVNPFQPVEPLPKLEVPGFKLDPDLFGDLLRELVGRRRLRIGGEITATPDSLLVLRLRGPGASLPVDCGPLPLADLEQLFTHAADILLARAAPYNLAYARERRDDAVGALAAAAAGADSAALPDAVRARCHLLCWRIYIALGRRDRAVDGLNHAATLAPADLVVVHAVGQHLARFPDDGEPGRDAWLRLAATALRWIQDQTDFDQWSVDFALQKGEHIAWRRARAADWVRTAAEALLQAHRAAWTLAADLVRPYARPLDLSTTALAIDHHLARVASALTEAAALDPDASQAAEIARLQHKRTRIAEQREALTDDRIRAGTAELHRYSETVTSVFTSWGQFFRELSDKIKQRRDDWIEGGVGAARSDLRILIARSRSYRDEYASGEFFAYSRFCSIADDLLSYGAILEGLIARPRLLRHRAQAIRRLMKATERLARWLHANQPRFPPGPFDSTPPPPSLAGPEPSPALQQLRQLRALLAPSLPQHSD